jgi:hypothetical protein
VGADGVSAAPFASSETTVASRSMVGPARFGRPEAGTDPLSSDLSSTITAVPLNVRSRNVAESAG